MDKHPYLATRGPIAFAHRGGNDVAPENTLAAFRSAYESGFRYMETDVHLTVDGTIVAFHDDRLDALTDRTGVIAQLTWDEISEARVGGREPVPRFDELFDEFPDARFNIDAKSDAVVEPLLDMIASRDAFDRVCVASFHDSRVRRATALAGDRLCTSAGRRSLVVQLGRSLRLPLPIPRVRVLQIPDRKGPFTFTTRTFVERAHADGFDVHVWTINRADDMHRVLDAGVDGVMTDRPSILKAVMLERGVWQPRP